MKNRVLFPLIAALSLGLAPAVPAAEAGPNAKPGYTVVLEISFDEQGTPTEATVVESDDPTGDHTLEQLAMKLSQQDKQPPHLQNGVAVKFKARRPFHFPVDGDQGPTANLHRPILHAGHQVLPQYPESLAESNVVGGAIVELTIQADGTVRSVRTLRASHPEFAQAAETALKQWIFLPDESPGAPAESRWNVAVGFTTNGQVVDLEWRLAPRPSIGGFIVARVPPRPVAPAAPVPPQPGK